MIALVDAWCARKSPELAALIDRLDDRSRRPPYAQLAGDPAQMVARLRAAATARDPRLTTALLAFLEAEPAHVDRLRTPFGSAAHDGKAATCDHDELWDLVMAALDRIRDPRLLPIAGATYERLWLGLPPGLRDRICLQLDLIVKATGRVRTANAEERDLEAAIASRLRRTPDAHRHEADVLEQIFAEPFVDAPRLVYQDLLLERGDPRGELIALQFKRRTVTPTEAERKREAELLGLHAKDWLGGLASVADTQRASATRFERGFVSTLQLHNTAYETLPTAWGAREWATVEELLGRRNLKLVLQNAELPALLRIREVIDTDTLATIAGRPEHFTRITRLEVSAVRASPQQWQHIFTCSGLPALRELVIFTDRWTADQLAILDADIAERLERIVLRSTFQPLRPDDEPLIRLLCDRGGRARSVSVQQAGWTELALRGNRYVRSSGAAADSSTRTAR
jgi:uncharacterized protein (TIGR02996 family)